MTMVEYSNWRDENPNGIEIGRSGVGEVGEWRDKLITKILVGMMFYIRHLNLLSQELKRLTSNGRKKILLSA